MPLRVEAGGGIFNCGQQGHTERVTGSAFGMTLLVAGARGFGLRRQP